MEEPPAKKIICGYCKHENTSIEDLKQHMKEVHILKSAAPKPTPTENKQTVLVYRQNPDGSTTNTGQIVQLTPGQIIQLISNPSQNKSDDQDEVARQIASEVEFPKDARRKQLQVVGIEGVAELSKAAAATFSTIEEETKPSRTKLGEATLVSSKVLSSKKLHDSIDNIHETDVSPLLHNPADELLDPDVVELGFQFNLSSGDCSLFNTHIKPVVSFQCDHCTYRDTSYVKACVHVRNFHLNPDGTIVKQTSFLSTDSHDTVNFDVRDDFSCPYCLLKFPSAQQRDEHRIKSCGPKKKYEVKRTAVRTLQRHLVCPKENCTRNLYFSDHPQAIKHPRATFGTCHRNNGDDHFFTCYLCAIKDHQEWKKQTPAQLKEKVNEKMKRCLDEVSESAGDALKSTSENSFGKERLLHSKKLIEDAEMKPWDFKTWTECAKHLLSEHSGDIWKSPQCDICNKVFNSCNNLCRHVFNSEKEYISNATISLHSRQNKKATKSGFLFGVRKDNSADEMLFAEIPDNIIAQLPVNQAGKPTRKVGSVRGTRYLCRTCGEGFSTMTRRDKHTLSNACTRVSVEKNFKCKVCNRRFQNKRTHVTHESWCQYKMAQRAAAEKKKSFDKDDGANDEEPPVETPDGDVDKIERPHAVRKPRPKNFKCTVMGCRMGFEEKEEMEIHLKCHINNTVAFQCCFCDFQTSSNISWFPLKEHIIAKHPGHLTPAHKCEICGKGFAKLTKYEDHMTKHTEDRPYECVICGLKFKQESGLRTHVQAEHGSEEAKEYMKVNMQDAKKAPQLLCHVCGYTTTSRSYYKTHMNIHKGVKPYSCKFCDYKSVDSTCFKRHMWRHKEDKPYKCCYCPFDGIQRAQIIAHMKSKHNVWPTEAKKLIRHISGRRPNNWKPDNDTTTTSVSKEKLIHIQVTGSQPGVHTLDNTQTILDDSSTSISQALSTTAASVSIVNPDGTETTIPVELLTHATDSSVQVSYGDYMINYIDKPEDVLEGYATNQ